MVSEFCTVFNTLLMYRSECVSYQWLLWWVQAQFTTMRTVIKEWLLLTVSVCCFYQAYTHIHTLHTHTHTLSLSPPLTLCLSLYFPESFLPSLSSHLPWWMNTAGLPNAAGWRSFVGAICSSGSEETWVSKQPAVPIENTAKQEFVCGRSGSLVSVY